MLQILLVTLELARNVRFAIVNNRLFSVTEKFGPLLYGHVEIHFNGLHV